MKLPHILTRSSFFYRLIPFFLSLVLLFSVFPPYARAADNTFVIPASDKVYTLEGSSTNKKNDAEYLALDGDIVYVIFTRRSDKHFTSGSVTITGADTSIELQFPQEHLSYDTLTIDDTDTILHPKNESDKDYVWQVGYFNLSDVGVDATVIIDAQSTAGGFSIDHAKYTLSVKYGLTVTKVPATVNGEPAQDPVVVDIGDEIGWHIIVKNSGDIDLTGIRIDDTLPGAILVDYDGPFNLATGESKRFLATYVVQPSDAGKQIVNTVIATTDHGLAEGGSSSASEINYAVIYDPNGGTDAPDPQTKYTDANVTITDGIPQRDGYHFAGWNTAADGSGTDYPAGTLYTENANLTLYAQWKKIFSVRFHANLPGVDESVFRTYYPAGLPIPDGAFAMTQNNTVATFYDIPEFDYETHNRYIFKGWYLADGTAMDWNTVYTEDTDIYAHWIETGSVAQADDDEKVLPETMGGVYPGYELVGIQLRGEGNDDKEHYGEAGSGLRFVSVLSQSVYSQINELPGNESGAEYGFVMAKAATIPTDAELLYKGSNVNGRNTASSHSYAINLKCSGVPDHYSNVDENGQGYYRLYTGVVTYKSAAAQGDEILQQAYSQYMVARAYIRYYDANGLLRTYHSNYTGNSRVGNGCSASYNMALEMLQKQ